jgi:hypothetical protein
VKSAQPRRGQAWIRRGLALALGTALIVAAANLVSRMPGTSHSGPLPPPTPEELALALRLEADVRHLAVEIGVRDLFSPAAVARAADWIEAELVAAGHAVERQSYPVGLATHVNLIVELPGLELAHEIVVIGAHYDTAPGTPGANDNASGVAALLALARALESRRLPRTLRLVAFGTEEPPSFGTADMGSRHHAARCRERGERVVAMLSLETIGYYSDEPSSQRYPPLVGALYPDRGDFIAVVGNLASRRLVRQVSAAFRAAVAFPSEGGALPSFLPGVAWSDHSSFWYEGFPAVMLTDTAPFRDPAYHRAGDTPERLDYPRLARVVRGLLAVTLELCGADA